MSNISIRIVDLLKLALLLLAVVCFSTDVRISGTLSVDPDVRPTFQLFEFFAIPLFFILIYGLIARINPANWLRKEDVQFLLFVAWTIATSWIAFDPYHAISRAKDFFLAWVLFVSVRGLSAGHIAKLITLTILLAAFWAAFGVMQMFDMDPWFGSDLGTLFKVAVNWKTVVNPISGEVMDLSFAQGIYLYPQNFTYYLLMPLFLSGWLVTKHKGWIILFLLIFVAIVGSGSKTFYLLALLVALWFAFRRFGKLDRLATAVMCICSIVIAILAGAVFLTPEHFMTSIGNFIWRTDQWADTFSMLSDMPYVLITGHGTEYLEKTYSRFNYPNPHNSILYFLIEYGVVGLSLIVGFLLSTVTVSRTRFQPVSFRGLNVPSALWLKGLERFIFAGLAFTLGMTVVDDYFVQTQLTAIFFFYLGLLVNLRRASIERAAGLVISAECGNSQGKCYV